MSSEAGARWPRFVLVVVATTSCRYNKVQMIRPLVPSTTCCTAALVHIREVLIIADVNYYSALILKSISCVFIYCRAPFPVAIILRGRLNCLLTMIMQLIHGQRGGDGASIHSS
jgi:hypothetical protein